MNNLLYSETAECRILADFELVGRTLCLLNGYLRERGLPPAAWGELELAVAEALNNAVEHGCAGLEGAEVICRWGWSGDTIRIEVTDPGHYAPPAGEPALPGDELAERGRGAFLMARLMDSVEHANGPAGHTIRLTKRVGPSAKPPSADDETEQVLEAMAEEVSRSYEVISALFKFSEALATLSNFSEFLDHSLQRLQRIVSGDNAFVRFFNPERTQLDRFGASASLPAQLPASLPADGISTEAKVAQTGQPVTLESCAQLACDDPFRQSPQGIFVCPVCFQSRVLGTLAVLQRPNSPYFSAGDLKMIRYVADFIGIVRTNAQLAEQRESAQRAMRELEIAAAIQRSLLPEKLPAIAGYRLHGVSVSAEHVGGDYFDVIPLGGDDVLLVIADVMGKGVPAALLATIFRTAIRANLELAQDPGRLLTAVNRQMVDDLSRVGMFITAQVGFLSARKHALLLASAGHCPVLHFASDQEGWAQSRGGGLPLGIFADSEYDTQTIAAGPGDLLLFLTDGLYEVENPAGQMLNIAPLAQETASLWRRQVPDVCTQLLEFVRAFSGGLPTSDDRTLLSVQRNF